MSDDARPENARPGAATEPEWRRRQRLAEVFEGVRAEPEQESPGDRWLREQVPPHHGG